MNIVIEDEYLLDTVTLLQVACSDGDIVEYAETIDGVPSSRMVSRGSDQCESIVPILVDDSINTLQHASCGHPGDSFRVLPEVRIKDGNISAMRMLWP